LEAKEGSSVRNTGRLTSIAPRCGLKEKQNLQESLTFQKLHFPKQESVVTGFIPGGYVIITLVIYSADGNLFRFFRLVLHSFCVQVQEEVPKRPNE